MLLFEQKTSQQKIFTGDVKSPPMNILSTGYEDWLGKCPVFLSRRVYSQMCLVEFIAVSVTAPMR
jgi:hypothetical protein